MRKSKLKNEKNNGKKIDETLDFKHEEFLNEFYSDEKNLLPELMKKRENLKNDFNDENKTFEQLLDIKNSIREIDLTIKKLKVKRKDNIVEQLLLFSILLQQNMQWKYIKKYLNTAVLKEILKYFVSFP